MTEQTKTAAERVQSLLDVFNILWSKCEQGGDCFEAGAEAGKALVQLGKPAAIGVTAVADPEWVATVVGFAASPERCAEFDQEVDQLHGLLLSLPFEAMLGLTLGARASGRGTELIDVPDDEANSVLIRAVKAVRTARFGVLAK